MKKNNIVNELLPKDPAWLADELIMLCRTGSHAYGTNTEDSDLDYKGIVIPPASYFLGLDSFEGYDKSGGKSFKNTSEDVDVTLTHINKFVRGAMAGVPQNLEMLFAVTEDYIYLDFKGKELIRIRDKFMSKQIMKKFGGYAKSQAMKMQNLKSNGAARIDLVEKYGFDTKFYMHTIRSLQMAIDILDDKTEFKTRRDNAHYLVDLRNGLHSLDQALDNIEHHELLLKEAYENTSLPEEPDYDFINNWLVALNAMNIKMKGLI